ncbi:MAG TPA: GAF domain-containing protein [Solirubrobacteraceae bacterium]|nr:GAF domain-containing protein [Solirubrobacteraceae bacterium]
MPARIADAGSSVQIDVIEFLADLLARSDEEGRLDDFYGRLCEAVTRVTSMRRAVIFRYDEVRRQVRAAGGFGLDLDVFADGFFTVDVAPMTRRALEEDRVIEARSDLESELPQQYLDALGVTQVVCAPMVARDRWIGVIFADRGGVGAPIDDSERETLWVLGKTAALAAMARVATRQHEKALQLEHRIELAQNVHDVVVQRLFGVSLALSGDRPFDERTRARCADELQAALADLRQTLVQPLGRVSAATDTTLAAEIDRLSAQHPELGIGGEGDDLRVPAPFERLAQAVLIEAVRNAKRHARPHSVRVSTTRTGTAFTLQIVNDGLHDGRPQGAGMGLLVAGFAALQAGGRLEFGPVEEERWRVRLTIPTPS